MSHVYNMLASIPPVLGVDGDGSSTSPVMIGFLVVLLIVILVIVGILWTIGAGSMPEQCVAVEIGASAMIRSARYDDVADFYEDFAPDVYDAPPMAALLHLVGNVAGLQLLDLACGHGRLTRELARRTRHSFERQRDFNPPEQRAAQHTLLDCRPGLSPKQGAMSVTAMSKQ